MSGHVIGSAQQKEAGFVGYLWCVPATELQIAMPGQFSTVACIL